MGDFGSRDFVQAQNADTCSETAHSVSARASPVVTIGPNQSASGKFGQVVVYNLTVTNLQAVVDYIDITYTSEPNGLSITLFEADGATLLKDSNADGDGIPDTGPLGMNTAINITVKITIPSDKYINEPEKSSIYATPSASSSTLGDKAILTTDAKPFLDVTQTADPTTIYLETAEIYNFTTKTRITLNVSGGGLPITAGNPLDIVLTLDNSGSMDGQPINSLVTAANNFVDKLSDEDRVAIYCFDGSGWPWNPAWPKLLLDWTFMTATGKTQAHNMINTLLFDTNYYTPIWDTIHDAIAKGSTALADHRPIVIAMTDGENNRYNYGVTEPQGPWPPYNNDGNVADDWLDTTTVRGLCEAPMTVFTIGLGIDVGSDQENGLKEIGLSSNPRGDYYYAPSPAELDAIYDSIAKKIMNVSGEDPDPSDNKPMITYVLPDYINFVQGTFRVEPKSIETDATPDKISVNPTNTTFEWNVDVIYINESWLVSFEVTSSKAGWVPVSLYPDSSVFYTNPIFPNITIPFPEVWIEVIPLPDLLPIDIMVDDIPYLTENSVVNTTPQQKLKISAKVKNIGDANTNIFSNHFMFIYYNSSMFSEPLNEANISSLESFKTSDTYHSYWEAPELEGLYKLIIFVDPTEVIPEGPECELNNKFNITIRVQEAPFIDLIPINVILDETYYDITTINISIEVEQVVAIQARAYNNGNLATNYYSPSFHITFSESSTPLNPFLDAVVDSLGPGNKTSSYEYDWQAPSVAGIYEIIIFVDATDVIPEGGLEGETNNKVYIIFNVTKDPLVDLILTEVEIQGIPYATSLPTALNITIDVPLIIDLVTGQTVNISSQAMNLGDTNTDEFISEFYLAYFNATVTKFQDSEPFRYESLKSLSPLNISQRYLANWTAPLVPGIYNITLFIDSTDLIPEGLELEFEDNNQIRLEFHVHELLKPPSPELEVSDEDVIIKWNKTSDVNVYYIYGGATPETIEFANALGSSNTNSWTPEMGMSDESEFYYAIRSADIRGWLGPTSYIIGLKSLEFEKGYNTFSLPLEPFITHSADWYTDQMFDPGSETGDIYKYDAKAQKWVGHPKGLPAGINDFDLELGESYMLYTANKLEYTFIGRPGTTIKYVDGIEDDPRIGTEPEFSKSLRLSPGQAGVVLTWNPAGDQNYFERVDHYNIYRSNTRYNFNFTNLIANTPWTQPETSSYTDTTVKNENCEYYYLVVPVNRLGREGSSTFSIGIYLKSYSCGYNGFALPLRLFTNITIVEMSIRGNLTDGEIFGIDFKNGIDTIYYYNISQQKWIGEPQLLPVELKHITVKDHEGYLVYIAVDYVKLCFIGH